MIMDSDIEDILKEMLNKNVPKEEPVFGTAGESFVRKKLPKNIAAYFNENAGMYDWQLKHFVCMYGREGEGWFVVGVKLTGDVATRSKFWKAIGFPGIPDRKFIPEGAPNGFVMGSEFLCWFGGAIGYEQPARRHDDPKPMSWVMIDKDIAEAMRYSNNYKQELGYEPPEPRGPMEWCEVSATTDVVYAV